MSPEKTNAPPPPARRFGAGTLAAAALAGAVVAAGGTWLVARPGGHAHAHAEAEAGKPAREQWQCPMHPSIVQDHPGDCPICGMKLVRIDAGATAPGPRTGAAAGSADGREEQEQWQCPMHPSVVQDHPGDCPICGMKLVKVESGSKVAIGEAASPEGLATVTIDPARQQLIGLKVAHVERGAVGGSWRTSGRVAVDETRVHHVPVKFSGYMEHVYADFVGRPVRRGEAIFSIYSPELLAAQQEFLLALDTRRKLGGAGQGLAADGDALVAAARRKLELWDVPGTEIDRLERTGQTTRTLTFVSPATGVVTRKDVVPGMKVAAGDMPFEIVDLSRVWFLADAYETDLRNVKVGLPATVSLKAFPERAFQGRVTFVDPLLDPKTRTAKVRIEVPNPTGELKPEMFGEVVLRSSRRTGLRIPADAVIHSGTKSVVFVAVAEGKFRPREVELGEGGGEFVEVASGLEAGDGVVTRANFLVDSESRLRASLASLASSAEPAAPVPAAAVAPAGGEGRGEAARPQDATPHAGHAGHGR